LSIQLLLKAMLHSQHLMNYKKPFLLSTVALAFLVCTVALVTSVSPTAFGQQQQDNTGGNQNMTTTTTTTATNNTATSTAGSLDCQTAASTLGGIVIPNPTGVCDVAVPRQGLQVQDTATGATLNNLLVINPLFEFTPVSNQGTTGAANQTMVYGFAEFALMEGELPSAMRMLSNSSWNVVAVHNHVIGESPSMIFAHAVANGDINTLVRDARAILDALMTQMQSQSGNQTATTTAGGGGGGNATTTGGDATGEPMNSSPSASSLTGGTTTGEGATAGGGVGTFGGGSGTGPEPGVGTTEGGQQQGEGTTGDDGGGDDTTGGAAGPQVRP
jgi:Domain of Unknown Function (DUF1259)